MGAEQVYIINTCIMFLEIPFTRLQACACILLTLYCQQGNNCKLQYFCYLNKILYFHTTENMALIMLLEFYNTLCTSLKATVI